MSFILGGVLFDGATGEVNFSKPVIDHYVRAGDDKIWAQFVRKESPITTLEAWRVVDNSTTATAHEATIRGIVGNRVTFSRDNGESSESVYIIDYRCRKRNMANGFLLQYSIDFIVDDRSQ